MIQPAVVPPLPQWPSGGFGIGKQQVEAIPADRDMIALLAGNVWCHRGPALAIAIAAVMKPGNIVAVAREATAWVEQALAVVKTAPDNPYRTDAEMAGAMLKGIEERKQAAGKRP